MPRSTSTNKGEIIPSELYDYLTHIISVASFLCDIYVQYSVLQFVAVAARDKARAQDFANKLNFRKAYSSYDDVANDPDVG